MPFVRVTRDQRGYENTFLLHSPQPGQRPVILYWYRTAPGVRVGRRAFDEEAIRILEEHHPEIEFDWVHLIEEAETIPPVVEHPVDRAAERRRRKARRAASAAEEATTRGAPTPGAESAAEEPLDVPPTLPAPEMPETAATGSGGAPTERGDHRTQEPVSPRRSVLLEELVGREIASRLRVRYRDLRDLVDQIEDEAGRAAWDARIAPLDPDAWATPDEVLRGIDHADRAFETLKRELEAARRPRA
jgi:hypothetical protein